MWWVRSGGCVEGEEEIEEYSAVMMKLKTEFSRARCRRTNSRRIRYHPAPPITSPTNLGLTKLALIFSCRLRRT